MIKQIAIENLLPNPFRKIESYPIVRQAVEELKKSMEETGVWVGIVARKAEQNSKYEIAFGHHRLAAIKELEIKEVPVDVQEIDDLRMVQQMAFENMSARKTNTQVITETVLSAREQIAKALDDWEWDHHTRSDGSLKRLFKNKKGFETWQGQRNKEIGESILINFLGPHWRANIAKALKLIAKADAGKLDLKAAEKFDSPSQAVAFAELSEETNIVVEKQEEFAEKVITDIQRIWGDEENPEDQSELTVSRIRSFGKFDSDEFKLPTGLDRERWEINQALENFTRELESINTGLPEILENWGMITDGNRRDFATAAKQFYEILQEGKETWKTMVE